MFLWIELWTNPKHILIKSMTLIPSFIFRLTIDSLLKLATDHHANVMSKVNFGPSPL